MVFLKKYWPLILAPILVLLAVRIVGSMDYHHNDNDFFTFWLAGHLVAQDGSPYDTAQWVAGYHQFAIGFIPNPAFLYPLPLALLLVPLGMLPLYSAYIIWVTLTQLMIIASLVILLSLETYPRARLFFVPLLAGIVLFRPTILTLTQGQVSGLFLFVLVWITYLWQKGQWFRGGLLLGLLALKPNLGFIVILLLAAWLLLQKRWRAILGIFVSTIFILIAGLIYDPGWVIQYWHVGGNKLAETFGGSPTVWGLGALISHNQTSVTMIIGGLTGLFILIGFFRAILIPRDTLPVLNLLALAVTVTLLITPYTWTYDQVLLILPITAVILSMDRKRLPFPLTASIFLGIDVLVVFLLIFDVLLQVEILNVVVPLVVFGLCLWGLARGAPAES
ncbi:MAG: glycosyltransferase family 87 protein [Anaerolineales bacterium]